MRRIIGTLFKVIAGIGVVAMLAYLGACVYGNIAAKPKGEVSWPAVSQAPYVLTVENTGTIILAPDVRQTGPDVPGQRTYELPKGYYEVSNGRFRYVKLALTMPESVWGRITVARRAQ